MSENGDLMSETPKCRRERESRAGEMAVGETQASVDIEYFHRMLWPIVEQGKDGRSWFATFAGFGIPAPMCLLLAFTIGLHTKLSRLRIAVGRWSMFNWRRKQAAPTLQPVQQVLPDMTRPHAALDEIIKVIGGRMLPDNFFTDVHLQEKAAIRGQAPTAYLKMELAALLGTVIDTSYAPYRYSVVIDVDAAIRDQFKADALVTMEIAIEVEGGMVGILWADEDHQPLTNTERFAIPGVYSVIGWAFVKQMHHLVFRNMATGRMRSSFRVLRISAMISD